MHRGHLRFYLDAAADAIVAGRFVDVTMHTSLPAKAPPPPPPPPTQAPGLARVRQALKA